MYSIIKATTKHSQLLAEIGQTSYLESHGHSASAADISQYVQETYNVYVFEQELLDPGNIYHIINYDDKPAGYSKIILNSPHPKIQTVNITKLERLYLLKEFYQLKLGYQLFQANMELSRQQKQLGMWLYVWKENQRAFTFYKRVGFQVLGSYYFKLTDSHSNPNHLMFLEYEKG